jgi:hypothetical protein
VEEMMNLDQMYLPIKKSLWFAHATKLWTFAMDSKKNIKGTKENR